MPPRPHTDLHRVRAAKTAVAAQDSKERVALAKAKARLAVMGRLKQLSVNDRWLGEVKSKIDAALKGEAKTHKPDAFLMKSIELLEKIAKEHDKLAQASAILSVPAKNVIRAIPHLKGPGA